MSQALSNIAVGSKIKFGKYQVNTETPQEIIWTVVAKNHTGYPENSVTLHSTYILDLRCFDAKEPNNSNSYIRSNGNHRYSTSNIDQWLNKDAAGGEWYVAAHSADHSPDTSDGTGGYGTQYADRPAFLYNFTTDEKNAILTTTIATTNPDAFGSLDDGVFDLDIQRKVFLLSCAELGIGSVDEVTNDGTDLGYYASDESRRAYPTRQCVYYSESSTKPSSTSEVWRWFTRSNTWGSSPPIVYSLTPSPAETDPCFGRDGVRPALNLSSSLLVSDSTDTDGCYTVVWESEPEQPTTYAVTVQNDGNGTASASPTTAEAGSEVTLTATANTGYHFSEWQVISPATGVTISDNKFTMPSSDVTIKAVFAADSSGSLDYPESVSLSVGTYDATDGDTVTISWSAVNDAESYKVVRKYFTTSPFVEGSVAQEETIYTGTSTSCTDVVGSWWHIIYGVSAKKGSIESGVNANAILFPRPPAPSSITVPALTAGEQAVISWSPVGNIGKYRLFRSVNGGDFVAIYNGIETSATDTIQSTYETVQYRVAAMRNSSDYLNYKTSDVITVGSSTPDEPETNEVLTAVRNHAKQDIIITPLTGTGGAISGSDIAVTGGGFTYTSVLNGDNDFTVGRAVSAQIETTLVNDSGKFTDYDFNRLFSVSLSILTNPEAESETDKYTEISLGVFQGERPEKVRGKLIEFRLYDLMTMFDVSAEEFITSLTFPTTLGAIYTGLCDFVGLTPSSTSGFTNSTKNFTANPFSSAGYTAREVLAWIAEAAGRYARMDEDGKVELIEFGTFSHKVLLTDRFEMSENEFVVPQIGKLEVYNSYGDQLVTAGTGSNTYVISDNPFLYIENDTEITSLQPFVTAIYNRLTLFPAYHPASVRCEWYPLIKCGDIITVIDDYGDEITFPVFSQTVTWNGFGKVEYENTGSLTRDIAPVRQRELEEIKKKMLRTADLSTAVQSYLNTQEGKASITSAVEGKFVEVATGSTITSTTQIEQLVENTENGINSKISISAGVGKGTIGSNVQALLTLFANTDTSSIRLSANALTLEATPGASETVDTETGTLHTYSTYGATDDSMVKFFAKTSDGYYTSQNAGIANSFAYGRLDFSFTSQTTVKLKCISYGESNFDYGIVSTLDSDLLWSRTADTSGVLHSFKSESSSSVQTLTLTVPSGSHYITFKYIKDSSNDSNDDTFKIRAYAETEAPSTSSVISLKSGGVQISSANVNFPGLVTFGDLAGDMTTKINGGNISTENLKVKQVFYNGATDDESFLILTSHARSSYNTIFLGSADGSADEIDIRAKYITFSDQNGNASVELMFVGSNATFRSAPDSSYNFRIGQSNKPINELYVDEILNVEKIRFSDGSTMTTAPS